jgi:hypothetical protein
MKELINKNKNKYKNANKKGLFRMHLLVYVEINIIA